MRFHRRLRSAPVVSLVAVLLAVVVGPALEGATIDYTVVMDNVSGFLDASSFTNQQVTIRMTGADTTNVQQNPPPSVPIGPFGY